MSIDKGKPEEEFGIAVHRKSGSGLYVASDKLQLIGLTSVFVNRQLVTRKENAILIDLKEYFQECMNQNDADDGAGPPDRAISDLFPSGAEDVDPDGETTYNTQDGIIASDGNNSWMMNTTMGTASNTYGRKWNGTMEAGTTKDVNLAFLGADKDGTNQGPGYFNVSYANQNFNTINLSSGDVIDIEWEIYIQ